MIAGLCESAASGRLQLSEQMGYRQGRPAQSYREVFWDRDITAAGFSLRRGAAARVVRGGRLIETGRRRPGDRFRRLLDKRISGSRETAEAVGTGQDETSKEPRRSARIWENVDLQVRSGGQAADISG